MTQTGLAEKRDSADTAQKRDRYLTFRVGGEMYAIDIAFIKEIVIKNMEITTIPEAADYFSGVINLRGKIIPVIDVRHRFKMGPIEYDEKTCIIVVHFKEIETGFMVERVAEVVSIPATSISPAPSIGRRADQRYVKGLGRVGDTVKIILNVENLINEEDLTIIENINFSE